ncbi:protein MpCYP707-like [Marchantia polymorpha subsp. ruderalis]
MTMALMDLSPVLVVVLVLLLLLLPLPLLFWRGGEKFSGKLPPKSRSNSIWGDTSAFWSDPLAFLDKKRAEYGEIYILKLFGREKIVTTTPEAAKFFLVNVHKSFKHGYRPSITRITDPEGNFTDPDNSVKVRKLLKTPLGPGSIRDSIPTYDALSRSIIDTWKDGEVLNAFHEMERITLKCILNLLWGQEDRQLEYDRVMELHSKMNHGCHVKFPINLPFTAYGKALKAKRDITDLLKEKLKQLRASRSQDYCCMSSVIFSDGENGLTDAQVSSLMLTLIFAGYRTTATVLVWVFKFLSENSKALEELQMEHDALSQSRESNGTPLTWADVKRMPYTMKVIQETLRLAPVVKFMPRVALEDVQFKGYVIPKDWSLGVSYEFHKDPAFFPDPLTFDPSRFNEPIKPGVFIPFGAGAHICVGYEFTNVLLPVIIHRVVSTYSFEPQGPDGVEFWPQYGPKGGLPMKVKLRAGKCL